MWTYHQLCNNGFKKYENKCKFLQSETLISDSILFLEQVEIVATSLNTYFYRSFCAAFNLKMMLTCRVLNNENIQDEAFTAIIKMFGIHLQVGIEQTVQRVTQCLWANIDKKPLNNIASWRNVTSYTEFPC